MDILDWYKGLFSNQLLILLGIFVLIIIFAAKKDKKAKKGGTSNGSKPKSKSTKKSSKKPAIAGFAVMVERAGKIEETYIDWVTPEWAESMGLDLNNEKTRQELGAFNIKVSKPGYDGLSSLASIPGMTPEDWGPEMIADWKRTDFELEKYQEKRKKNILEKYGDEIGLKLINEELWLGMNKEMILASQGKPDNIVEKVSRNKKREELFYGKHKNRRGSNWQYKFRIVLEDDEVVSWNDIA
jgi:hypothetical protein